MDIVCDTRQSARRALDRQPVNGFGVKMRGGFVCFRPYRDRWELAQIGSTVEHLFFKSPTQVLDLVFEGMR